MQSQSSHDDAAEDELIGCVICCQLATRDALKKHIAENHFNCFPHKCETCGLGANEAGAIYHHAEETGHRVALNGPPTTSPVRKLLESIFTECIKERETAEKAHDVGSMRVERNEEESYSRRAQSTSIETAPEVPLSTSRAEILARPKFVASRNGANPFQSVSNSSTLRRSATSMKLQSTESASVKAGNTYGRSCVFNSSLPSKRSVSPGVEPAVTHRRKVSLCSDRDVDWRREFRATDASRTSVMEGWSRLSAQPRFIPKSPSRCGAVLREGARSSAGVVCKLCDKKIIEGSRRDHVATKHAKYVFRCPVAECNYRTSSLGDGTAFEQLKDHLIAQHGGRKNLSRREKDEVSRQVELEKNKRLDYFERCFPKRGVQMESKGLKRFYATPSTHRLGDKRMKRC